MSSLWIFLCPGLSTIDSFNASARTQGVNIAVSQTAIIIGNNTFMPNGASKDYFI